MKKIVYLLSMSFLLMTIFIGCGGNGSDKPKDEKKTEITANDTAAPKEETKAENMDAKSYNDNLIDIQNSVITEFLALSQTFSSNDKASIDAAYKKSLEVTKKAVGDIKSAGPYEGDDEFRLKLQALLEFYQSIVENEYKEMIKIISKGSKIKPKDMDRLKEIQASITERETKLDADMAAAQSGFAVKHGFRLETNKLQKDIDNMNK
mgnify:CR=1 FL=1